MKFLLFWQINAPFRWNFHRFGGLTHRFDGLTHHFGELTHHFGGIFTVLVD